MRTFWVCLFFVSISGINSAFAESGLKPFKDWKNEKIIQISNKILATKAQIENFKGKKVPPQSIQHFERILVQEAWNLEVARDLSVTDYLVLYLASFPSKTRFQQAAQQFSPSETAELMEAYFQSLGLQEVPQPLNNTARAVAPVGVSQATQRR